MEGVRCESLTIDAMDLYGSLTSRWRDCFSNAKSGKQEDKWKPCDRLNDYKHAKPNQ